MALATPLEISRERMRATAAVFEMADRTLTGDDIRCRVVEDNSVQAPGYSDGSSIFFNLPYIGGVQTTDDIIKVTGLNFHELAHTMFTPRSHSRVGQIVQNEQINIAFNILEDERIEGMVTALYPSTIPYFVMVVMEYLAKTPKQWEEAHILTHGRKYLPVKIRTALRDRFKGDATIRGDIEKCIDEYRLLVYPDDEVRALQLIREFHALIAKFDAQHPQPQSSQQGGAEQKEGPGGGVMASAHGDPFGHASGTRPGMTEGAPFDGEDQQSTKEWVEGNDEARAEEENAAGAGGGEGPDSKGKGGTGAGAKSDVPNPPPSNKDMTDAINETYKQHRNSPEVIADAKGKIDAISNSMGKLSNLDPLNYKELPASGPLVAASRQFGKELRQLQVDADPGWHTHKSSGRVSISRAMRDEPNDTVFDVWDEGVIDATDLDMVIMVDVSGSMDTSMGLASQALWGIKRAVETVGGEVTVLAFNSSGYTMYSRKDKAKQSKYRHFSASGGTDPGDVISTAAVMFDRSVHRHKIALFISDGSWSRADNHNSRIEKFKAAGVATAFTMIAGWGGTAGVITNKTAKHNCEVGYTIESPADLVPFAKQITKAVMRGQKH